MAEVAAIKGVAAVVGCGGPAIIATLCLPCLGPKRLFTPLAETLFCILHPQRGETAHNVAGVPGTTKLRLLGFPAPKK